MGDHYSEQLLTRDDLERREQRSLRNQAEAAEVRNITLEADNAKLQRKVERLTRHLGAADFCCPPKTTCPGTLNSDPPEEVCIACWNEWAEKGEEKHE